MTLGPALALITAALWAISPMLMASAGRRVGSFPVVLLRSLIASFLLAGAVCVMSLVGILHLPDRQQVAWLSLSGVLGMGVGDVLIYEAFVLLGPRRTTQVLVLAPPIAVLCGWAMLGEQMGVRTLIGIAIILGGAAYAVLAGRKPPAQPVATDTRIDEPIIAGGESGDVETSEPSLPVVNYAVSPKAEPGHISLIGILVGVGGAICMALGAVTGRQAFRLPHAIDPVAATFVRVFSAAVFLWAWPLVRMQLGPILRVLPDRQVMGRILLGTLIGPFVGMFCYVAALRTTPAGLVSTLVATSPLFALPVTMLRYRTRIGWDIWLAAALATGGVYILFVQ